MVTNADRFLYVGIVDRKTKIKLETPPTPLLKNTLTTYNTQENKKAYAGSA